MAVGAIKAKLDTGRGPYFKVTVYRDGGARTVHLASGAVLEMQTVDLSIGPCGHAYCTFKVPPGGCEVEFMDGKKPEVPLPSMGETPEPSEGAVVTEAN